MTTKRTNDGNPLDENGLLKDGHALRVPMMLRDADSSDWRNSMDRQFHDGHNGSVGHRPGFVVGRKIDGAPRAAAYSAYDAAIGEAWRRNDAAMSSAAEGAECTISGAHGHLRQHGNVLVCVPDRQPDQQADDSLHAGETHSARMARLYDSADFALSNKWRS